VTTGSITPQEFVDKWRRSGPKERAASQEHFGTTVLDAYDWPHDLSDDDILERLLALNLERASAQENRNGE